MTKPRAGSRAACALAALVLCLGIAEPAAAFYPFGGTSLFTLDIRFVRWALEDMDTNGDGEVDGPNEGVLFTIEDGPLGFTDPEIAEIQQGFEVWEGVSSSYAAFRFDRIFNPLPNLPGINMVHLVTDDPNDEEPAELGGIDSFMTQLLVDGDVVVSTILSGTVDDTVFMLPDGTTQFMVEGGRIFDVDMFILEEFLRGDIIAPAPIRATDFVVSEAGTALGLGFSPLNNLEFFVDDFPIESPVFTRRNGLGLLETVGVTSTMFPAVFLVEDGFGGVGWGMTDLAPEDEAGVTFLYPRETQTDLYVPLGGTARTQSLGQVPSEPLLGGLVTAWIDTDGGAATGRVPVFSTMTGLYEPINDLRQRGNFLFPNLLSVVDTTAGDVIQASYTFTIQPISLASLPFLDQTLFSTPEEFDSTHGGGFGLPWPAAYNTTFPSEVFLKEGELFGAENADFGTPLAWDPVRRRVVDPRTGQTLNQILAKDEPFFGDESVVCPLLLGTQDFPAVTLLGNLRHFRDNYLLASAAGAAVADAFYQAGPAMVAFLKQHPMLLAIFGAGLAAADFMLVYPASLMALVATCGAFILLRRRRRMAAAVVTLLALCTFLATSATAAILPVSEQDMVAKADYVLTGRILAVQSEVIESPEPKVWTTVTLEVGEALKGRANKGGHVHLRMPGGIANGIFTHVPDLPTFEPEEEVVLFLRDQKSGGYGIVAGQRGTHRINTDPETGEKHVVGANIHSSQGIADVAEAQKDADEPPADAAPGVTLDAYRDFVQQAVE